jgi:hypothetical protein
MNYLLVLLGILLIIIMYIIYIKVLGDTSVLNKNTYLKTSVPPVDLKTLTTPGSSRFAYSFWVYVNELTASGVTPIFTVFKETADTSGIFRVQLNTTDIILNVLIAPKDSDLSSAVTVPIMKNFPLQKWVCVVVSLDNSQLDLYVDGKIVNSRVLPITPALPVGTGANIKFGTGDMYISTLNRQTTPMDPQTAWTNYMSGNAGFVNMFSTYGLDVNFNRDSVVAQKFTIF